MKIELRTRKLQTGNRSLYLEFYEKGGKRTYESLNLFLIPEVSKEDRRINENTLKHALKIKSERVLDVEKPEEEVKERIPSRILTTWMDEYLLYLMNDRHVAMSTYRTVNSVVNIVKTYLKASHRPRMLLANFDKQFYKELLSYIITKYKNTKDSDNPKPLSDATKFMVQSHINTMLQYAVKAGLLPKHPYSQLSEKEKFKRPHTEKEYLTVEEIKALENVETGSPATKQGFLFCCFTGLRHSDLKSLKWGEIKHTNDGDAIVIPSMVKTKKDVMIPLGTQAKRWMPDRNDATDSDPVFPDIPILSCCDSALKHMAEHAGIEKNISFHTARHTFATLTITASSDLATTSSLLGHTNVKTTEIYAKVVMKKKINVVNMTKGLFS